MRLSANEISSSFENNIDRLSNLTRLPEVTGGETEAQRKALESFRNQLILFDAGTYILDNLGTVVASLPEDPWLNGQDWSSRSFFAYMIRNPGLFFSNIEPAGPRGENVISIAVPITGNNDEFVGVAVGMCSLDVSSASPFFANLIKLRVGRSGNAYLVDKNRMVIYATDTAYINTYFTAHPVVNQDFQNRVGVVRTLAEDGNMFGFPRLNSLLSSSGQNQLEGEALIQFLMARLGDFTGPGWEQEDDITMVAAKRLETDPG